MRKNDGLMVAYLESWDDSRIELFFVHRKCYNGIKGKERAGIRIGDYLADFFCTFDPDKIRFFIREQHPDKDPDEIYRELKEMGCIICEQDLIT